MHAPSDQLRDVDIQRGYLESNPASVLYRCGRTIVLCTASLEAKVPPWLEGKGKGWVTAEYNMLPGSTSPRKRRDRGGKIDGRTTEIQRLIGRSLRSIIDLNALRRADDHGRLRRAASRRGHADGIDHRRIHRAGRRRCPERCPDPKSATARSPIRSPRSVSV